MGRLKTVKTLIKTKTERFSYDNVFLEALLDDIEYISQEYVETYYRNAEEVFVEAGEIYCFTESESHEPNFRMTARKDFEVLIHEDKDENVSVLVPLDQDKYIIVPTDNFNPANALQLLDYCNSVRGKIKRPTALIIKNNS